MDAIQDALFNGMAAVVVALVGWRIDYFFVSQGLKDRLKDAFILSDIEGSDHAPVGIDIDL